jgi:hypothetical protein
MMSDGKVTHHQIRHPQSHANPAGQEERLRQEAEVQAMNITRQPMTYYFWLGADAEAFHDPA